MTEPKTSPEPTETVGTPPSASGRERAPVAPAPMAATAVAVTALAVTALALGVVWAYYPVLGRLWRSWMSDPNYSHGVLVIPVACLIFWSRGRQRTPTPPWPWALIFLALVLGARVYFYDRGNQWAEAVTLLPVLGCLALIYGGQGVLRRAWPAIAFLIFMIPLPQAINTLIALPLQTLATTASCGTLKLTGLWVVAEGNVIYVGNQPLEVAIACNGLSMLMCLSATVVAAVLLVPMPPWLRTILLLSAPPIALASNVLRIVATAWCYQRFGSEVGTCVAHDGAGWLMMPTAILLVGFELWLINRVLVVEEVPVEPSILGKRLPGKRERTALDRPAPKPEPTDTPARPDGQV